jgi:nucleoside-diphosphate-sugar epimerase
MKIFVTGGSGFIGTNLVSDLLSKGHQVVIYDKRKSKKYPELCKVADIRDKEKLRKSMRGIDAVYHLAAEHSDKVRPVSLYYDVNVGGAKNLVQALEANGVKNLIFTSTVAVYGLSAAARNENSPIKPFNDYGRSKYKSELVFNEWAEADNQRFLVTVRPTVIFGEDNRGNVYRLFRQINSGIFIMVGNGKNKKSITYVRNISQFLTKLLIGPNEAGIHIYNYADKPDLTTDELVRITLDTLGKKPRINLKIPSFTVLWCGYAFDFLAAITKKKYTISSIRIRKFFAESVIEAEKLREIGFSAPYSLDDGIVKTVLHEFPADIHS